VGLLWEIYNLRPDSTGVARYGVDLTVTVQAIERHSITAQVVGGILDAMGLSARGDDWVAMHYDRDVDANPDGTEVEYLVLDLRSDQAATYEITLTITDGASGRRASATRQFRVTARSPGQ
jgi:hypothetical protein